MRAVNIADLKNNLSRYLNEVRAGQEVLIKDRNRPIARIVPLAEIDDEDAELKELVAEGSARPPITGNRLPSSFWSRRPPKTTIDLVGLIREDRDPR
jgi:prevent-host-death family protein